MSEKKEPTFGDVNEEVRKSFTHENPKPTSPRPEPAEVNPIDKVFTEFVNSYTNSLNKYFSDRSKIVLPNQNSNSMFAEWVTYQMAHIRTMIHKLDVKVNPKEEESDTSE